jgi:hypothetical protein
MNQLAYLQQTLHEHHTIPGYISFLLCNYTVLRYRKYEILRYEQHWNFCGS